MKTFIMTSVALASLALAGAAYAGTQTFDGPVTGTVDRYAPATFQSGVAYGGHSGTLSEGTSVADGANNRPAAYSSSFYNTQGESLALGAGVTDMSVQLYNDPLYATDGKTDERIAGFWGVGVDSTNTIQDYPIVELDKVAGALELMGWNSTGNGGWINLTQTMGAAGSWDTLGIALTPSAIDYYVNGNLAGSVNSGGSTAITSAIFQVYNTTAGTNDFAHWDNLVTGNTLTAAGVPEPATWAMMLIGFGGLGSMLRANRRQQTTRLTTI